MTAPSDKLALVPDGSALAVDVGEDGTIDFRFDGSTFSSINVQAGDGDDTVDGEQRHGGVRTADHQRRARERHDPRR